MTIFVAGLSYRTAPVEVREKVAVHASQVQCIGCRLKIAGQLSEVVVLSTCNRVEIYGVTARRDPPVHAFLECLTTTPEIVEPHMFVRKGVEAVKHLFSVASGMDSMVLGETEITGQVKNAYAKAREARLTGRVLNRVLQTALQTVKDVRTHTNVGRGATSVGSATVEMAEKIFDGNLEQKTIMIVGAGKMGEACVRHLSKRGAKSVLVSNRSFERAEGLAKEFGGRAIRFDECRNAMVEADIVVSSTGASQTILHREEIEQVMKARRNRPLVMIDIAVPRDLDPMIQTLENVYLYNIDDLETLVRENVRLREKELAQCCSIIDQRTEAVMAKVMPPETTFEPRREAGAGWAYGGVSACVSLRI
jgi:glutamyl-tRNA reductase